MQGFSSWKSRHLPSEILERRAIARIHIHGEGIYSSYLSAWRKERERGELSGLGPKKRGRKAQAVDARDRTISELQREVTRLTARAEKAEAIVEIQKKLGQLFGVQMPEPPDPTRKP